MDDVFEARWGGTVDGCRTHSEFRADFIETYESFQGRVTYDSDSSDNEYCDFIPAEPPVN